VLGAAADGFEAIQLVQSLQPDVAVLDLIMPRMNGLDAARAILQISPKTMIVILSMCVEEHQVLAAMRSGARAYVTKSETSIDLVQAIRTVARGGMFLSRTACSAVANNSISFGEPPDPLEGEEWMLLRMIAEGKTTSEIADVLRVGPQLAETFRAALMNKLHIHDIPGLVRYAIRRGLIQPALVWGVIVQQTLAG
jgi:DNA-binding NarL/FixJ family response regulator